MNDKHTEGSQEEYQKFFKATLKKFEVSSPSELTGDKEKEFYDYIDKNWKGEDEKKESSYISIAESLFNESLASISNKLYGQTKIDSNPADIFISKNGKAIVVEVQIHYGAGVTKIYSKYCNNQKDAETLADSIIRTDGDANLIDLTNMGFFKE